MSAYLKAVIAAIVTGIGAVAAVVQSAITDGEITPEEWGLIATAVIVAVAAVVGVYKARNTPPA